VIVGMMLGDDRSSHHKGEESRREQRGNYDSKAEAKKVARHSAGVNEIEVSARELPGRVTNRCRDFLVRKDKGQSSRLALAGWLIVIKAYAGEGEPSG
jgi:hypothetical protein